VTIAALIVDSECFSGVFLRIILAGFRLQLFAKCPQGWVKACAANSASQICHLLDSPKPRSRCGTLWCTSAILLADLAPLQSDQLVSMPPEQLLCEPVGDLVGFGINSEHLPSNGPASRLIRYRAEARLPFRIGSHHK